MMADIRTGPVVVGVSLASGSRAALAWAAEYAELRGLELVAVHAWRPPRPPATAGTRPPVVGRDVDAALAAADIALHEAVRAALESTRQVRFRVLQGGKVKVLLEAAAGASLLVIDAPRRSRVGQASLAARLAGAPCPLVVMPPRA